MMHLEKIDAKTLWDVVCLELEEEQKEFVPSNEISIAQAYTAIGTDCSVFPFGIYDDEENVGFLMIAFNLSTLYELEGGYIPEVLKNNYCLWRLMIDKDYQKRGYGREAVKLALEFIRTWPCGKAEYCALSSEPWNEAAKKLYASFGFVENGDVDGDEVVAVLKL